MYLSYNTKMSEDVSNDEELDLSFLDNMFPVSVEDEKQLQTLSYIAMLVGFHYRSLLAQKLTPAQSFALCRDYHNFLLTHHGGDLLKDTADP